MKILDDILGKKVGNTFVEGLVDTADDIGFQNKLGSIQECWRSFEMSSTCNIEKFIEYFNENKVPVLRDNMSRSLRVECGLGCPPDIFTTNASECQCHAEAQSGLQAK